MKKTKKKEKMPELTEYEKSVYGKPRKESMEDLEMLDYDSPEMRKSELRKKMRKKALDALK